MSMLALDSDMLRSVGIEIKRRDPSDGMRGWKSATLALENFRIQFERETQEKFFLIADERDRAKFAKAQSYMLLVDTQAMCKNPRCRKRFDISGVKTVAFL